MNFNNTTTPPLGGLTAASRDFATKAALDYAVAHDMDFPTAVKTLIQNRKNYEASPATELAGIAKKVSGELRVPYSDVAERVESIPSAVKKLADDWLMERARVLARGNPGLIGDNESQALIDAITSGIRTSPMRATPENSQITHSGLYFISERF